MALRAWPSWIRPDRPEPPPEVPTWLQEAEQERLLDLYRQLVGELRRVPRRRRPRRVA